MIDGMSYPSQNSRSLRFEQVPNLTAQENLHHYHRKRAKVPLNNYFTTDTDYTNRIILIGGIAATVGVAYMFLWPMKIRTRRTYSLFSF